MTAKMYEVMVTLRVEAKSEADATDRAVRMFDGREHFPETEITYECGGSGGFFFVQATDRQRASREVVSAVFARLSGSLSSAEDREALAILAEALRVR